MSERTGINKPEPPPVRNEHPAAWDLVLKGRNGLEGMAQTVPAYRKPIRDMKERDAFGAAKYGVRLQPFNGREGLVDLYQELLDAVVYARLVIYEHRYAATGFLNNAPGGFEKLYGRLLNMVIDVRAMIDDLRERGLSPVPEPGKPNWPWPEKRGNDGRSSVGSEDVHGQPNGDDVSRRPDGDGDREAQRGVRRSEQAVVEVDAVRNLGAQDQQSGGPEKVEAGPEVQSVSGSLRGLNEQRNSSDGGFDESGPPSSLYVIWNRRATRNFEFYEVVTEPNDFELADGETFVEYVPRTELDELQAEIKTAADKLKNVSDLYDPDGNMTLMEIAEAVELDVNFECEQKEAFKKKLEEVQLAGNHIVAIRRAADSAARLLALSENLTAAQEVANRCLEEAREARRQLAVAGAAPYAEPAGEEPAECWVALTRDKVGSPWRVKDVAIPNDLTANLALYRIRRYVHESALEAAERRIAELEKEVESGDVTAGVAHDILCKALGPDHGRGGLVEHATKAAERIASLESQLSAAQKRGEEQSQRAERAESERELVADAMRWLRARVVTARDDLAHSGRRSLPSTVDGAVAALTRALRESAKICEPSEPVEELERAARQLWDALGVTYAILESVELQRAQEKQRAERAERRIAELRAVHRNEFERWQAQFDELYKERTESSERIADLESQLSAAQKRVEELEHGIVEACGGNTHVTIDPLKFLRNHLHSLQAETERVRAEERQRAERAEARAQELARLADDAGEALSKTAAELSVERERAGRLDTLARRANAIMLAHSWHSNEHALTPAWHWLHDYDALTTSEPAEQSDE